MIYVITGQTATGKTSRALEIAIEHHGELINCDARQMYKKLDIVTGKDLSVTSGTFTRLKSANMYDIGYYEIGSNSKIWLYDIVQPEQSFSAFEYRKLALEVIRDMLDRGKTPIIVGGSYFYLQHLLYDILEIPIPSNPSLRETLKNESTENLQKILISESPDTFNLLNNSEKYNTQRLIRKIEIVRSGAHVPLPHKEDYIFAPPFDENAITMEGFQFAERSHQHTVITQRIESRIKEGAIDEVEKLLASGYTGEEPGLQTIGYQQIIRYLHKELAYEAMVKEWRTREIQYAKRQYTFAKRDPHISWVEV